MDDKRRKQLESVDDVLSEVREQLQYSHEQGDVYELRALQLLLQVTKAMHSRRDIYDLITLVLDSALSFAEADRAFLLLFDASDQLRFKMGRTYEGEYLGEADFVVSTGVIQEVLNGQRIVILSDAQMDAQFNKRQSVQDLELRTIMAAPLNAAGAMIGLIYVDSKRPLTRYSKHHLNVLTSLADQAAVAITNAQKFETHQGG